MIIYIYTIMMMIVMVMMVMMMMMMMMMTYIFYMCEYLYIYIHAYKYIYIYTNIYIYIYCTFKILLYYMLYIVCVYIYICYTYSKEVWKSNFRQYGEMKKQSAARRVRRKKMQVREKVGKSRNTVFFRGFVAPGGWKVGSLKRRVRRHLGRWEMKSCTPLWREAHLEVKCVKNWGVRTTFGSWDVEKVHTVVARSTFRSQNVQNTPFSDHFWKLRCRKSARRCGAKHISKTKC